MITGLAGASVWSEDLNRLLPFYRDVLGLTATVETPGFVLLGKPGTPALALGTHSAVRGRNGARAGAERRPGTPHGGPDERRRRRGLEAAEGRRGRVHREAHRLRRRAARDPQGSRRQLRPAAAVQALKRCRGCLQNGGGRGTLR